MTEESDRAAKEHTGAMLAFMLEPSDSAALRACLPPEVAPVDDDVLHLTLMYLGDRAAYPDDMPALIGAALEVFAAEHGPLSGVIGGVGRFDDIDADGTSALYASFDAPGLPAFRERLVDHLAQIGVVSPSDHGFTPHITLAYLPPGAQPVMPDLPQIALTFRGLTLAWGDAHFYYPLNAAMAPSFQVTKGLDGRMHWVLISSNSFQDREGEIVSQKALEADVARADQAGDYGTLDWWHLDGYPDKRSGEPTPLAILGACRGNAMHGRMLVEWGDFISEGVGQAVKAIAPELAVSIAFLYPEGEPDAQGVYHHIRRYSRALLPRRFASNPLTALPIIVQEEKHMVKEKIAALRLVMGGDDALVDQVLQLATAKEQAALSAGVRHKEAAPVMGEFTPAAGETVEQKATITIADDDKPKDDEKPKDEAPKDEAPPAAEGEKPAEGEPPAGGDPNAPPAAPADNTIGRYTEQQLAEYVVKCMDAYMEQREAAGADARGQAAKEAREVELLQTVKEVTDALATLRQEVESARAGAQTALDGVAELAGETPRARKGFRASEEGREIGADEAEQKTKQFAGPSADPLSKHWGAVMGAFRGNGQNGS